MLVQSVNTVSGHSLVSYWNLPMTVVTIQGQDYLAFGKDLDKWAALQGTHMSTIRIGKCKANSGYNWVYLDA